MHVAVLVCHVCHAGFTVYFQITVLRLLVNYNDPHGQFKKNLSRLMMYTTDAITQIVMLHLFKQYAHPAGKQRQESSSSEEEELIGKNSNLEMLYYMKTKPIYKTKKVADSYKPRDLGTLSDSARYSQQDQEESDNDDFQLDSYQLQSFHSRASQNWTTTEDREFKIAVYTTFFNDKEIQRMRNQIKKARLNLRNSDKELYGEESTDPDKKMILHSMEPLKSVTETPQPIDSFMKPTSEGKNRAPTALTRHPSQTPTSSCRLTPTSLPTTHHWG